MRVTRSRNIHGPLSRLSATQSRARGLCGPKVLVRASNVKVVVGALRATRNLLKSQTEKNLLSPYCNIRAVTSKLCAYPRLAIVADLVLNFFVAQRRGSGFVQSGFY